MGKFKIVLFFIISCLIGEVVIDFALPKELIEESFSKTKDEDDNKEKADTEQDKEDSKIHTSKLIFSSFSFCDYARKTKHSYSIELRLLTTLSLPELPPETV